MPDVTPEQVRELRNMSLYGPCPECGEPRELHRIVETHLDGHTTDIRQLRCKNLHVESPAASPDEGAIA